MAHGNKGKIAWNRGLTKETDERVRKYSESGMKKHWSRGNHANRIKLEQSKRLSGKKLSKERCKQISECVSGDKNPMFGRNHSEETKQKLSVAAKNRWNNDEFKTKWLSSHWSKNSGASDIGKKISITKSEMISNGVLNLPTNHGFKNGTYWSNKMKDGFYYRSSYELIRYGVLEKNDSVVKYTPKHGIVIEYEHDGKLHKYIPDILIEYSDGSLVLEEVKGWINNQQIFEEKCESAIDYCNFNNMKYRVIFKEGLFDADLSSE